MLEAKDEEINNLKASCKSAEESDARAKQELQLRVEKVTDLTEKLTETEAARDDLQRKMDAINSAKTAFDLAMSQVNADGTSSPSKNVGTKKTAPVSYTSFEPKQGSWKFICLIESKRGRKH
ncbi:Protein CBG26196 [Caenorhabditis briggsae]|uniref:Protein CBG26196 n=1 Tax=Caenorhabditis briggsae TaxID=6238 RepID=B6ILU1_CAEBR|nr:Protein CBG26196 [Caenorhabditis briggsae]CAS00871.1 Protein CBG26196 [Caenorhabditis briggsae]